MTNTTATYWDIDGTSLQTFCTNVTTLAPKWGNLPKHRGDNQTASYRHGSRWRAKYLEARTMSLAMNVVAWDADGNFPTATSLERQFNKNITALRDLMWRVDASEVALTKRWRDPDTGTVHSATAQAEFVGDFALEMHGPHAASVVADFVLADPFFYGPEQTDELAVGSSSITTLGDAETTRITIDFNGQLTNPELINSAYTPNVKVKAALSVAVDDVVRLDVNDFTAIRDSDSDNVVGAITRSGARPWMKLQPGVNPMELAVTGGAGTATVKHFPAYL